MADVKISALPAATTPLAGTEVLPIVQSSTTKKVAISDVTAGRAISASSLTLTTPLSVANGGTGTSTAFTAGSVVFAGASGTYSQDNANFFWDDTNNYLGLGTASPAAALHVVGETRLVRSGTPTQYLKYTGDAAGANLTSVCGAGASKIFTLSDDANGGGINITAVSSSPIVFSTGNYPWMTLNASGNLGLGVTPSAWGSVVKAIQLGGTYPMIASSNAFMQSCANAYFDGTNFRYISSNYATRYLQNAGVHNWDTSASGTAGNAITFTQAMTLDASGNLLVGTTTSSGRVTASGSDSNAVKMHFDNQQSGTYIEFIAGGSSGYGISGWDYSSILEGYSSSASGTRALVLSSYVGPIIFQTNSRNERARIDSSGNVGIGTSSPSSYGKLAVLNGNVIAVSNSSSSSAALRTSNNNNYVADWVVRESGYSTYGAITANCANLYYGYGDICITADGSNNIKFGTGSGAPERARIDSSGNLLVNTTAVPSGWTGMKAIVKQSSANTYEGFVVQCSANSTGTYVGNTGSVGVVGTTYGSTGGYVPLVFETSSTERARIDTSGNVVINTAAIATTATDGFLYVPTCAGTPTGTPTTYTGRAPIVVNTTDNKLYFYSGGAWRDAGP